MTIDLFIKSLLGARKHDRYFTYTIYYFQNNSARWVDWFYFTNEYDGEIA